MSGTLAIIPARGGSKRIPKKNLALVAGKPLLAHTILQALRSSLVSRVAVSTDDPEIARTARVWGAEVISRPKEIAGDHSTSEQAILHVLDHLERQENYVPELVVLLQATAPVRAAEDIDGAIRKLLQEGTDSIFSAVRASRFMWRVQAGKLGSFSFDHLKRPRSQDFPEDYFENGSIFVFKPAILRKHGNRLGGRIAVYPMDYWSSFDIDDPEDLELVDWILRRRTLRHAPNPIGILQGRLSPPVGGELQAFPALQWEKEFPMAQKLGLDAIEWLFTFEGYRENPIWSLEGVRRIGRLAHGHGIRVPSLCADFFVVRGFSSPDSSVRREASAVLTRLMEHAAYLGMERILIPFFYEMSLDSEEQRTRAAEELHRLLPQAEERGLHLSMEAEIPAETFAAMIDAIGHPALKVYYDLGNAAAMGFDLPREIRTLGGRISGVHVKDRKRGGGTVLLGKGDADFPSSFQALIEIGYRGPYILQAARGEDEAMTASRNLHFLDEICRRLRREKEAV